MDKKLHILHHLYAEEQDPDALYRLIRDDEALRQEYAALADVKRRLDRRPCHRPDAAVVDQVAAAAGWKREARRDRASARPGRRRIFGLIGTVCTTLLVLAVVGVQLFSSEGIGPAEAPLAERDVLDAAQTEEAASPSEAPEREALETEPPTSERLAAALSKQAARSAKPAAAPALAQDEARAEVPVAEPATVQPVQPAPLVMASTEIAWDDASKVRRLHRRIELVQARSRGLAWGDPVVEASEAMLSEPLLRESLFDVPPTQPQLFQVDQLQVDQPYTLPRNR